MILIKEKINENNEINNLIKIQKQKRRENMTEYSIFKILFLIIGSKHIFILYTKSTCNKQVYLFCYTHLLTHN